MKYAWRMQKKNTNNKHTEHGKNNRNEKNKIVTLNIFAVQNSKSSFRVFTLKDMSETKMFVILMKNTIPIGTKTRNKDAKKLFLEILETKLFSERSNIIIQLALFFNRFCNRIKKTYKK